MTKKKLELVIICGPPASGKMTVGQELQKLTDYKLFYNHMSLDLVNQFFDFGTPDFNDLDKKIRFDIFKAIATSDIKGLIFTMAWAFNEKEDDEYVDEIIGLFENRELNVCIVELKCEQDERLRRNRTENRLKHKVSKRDIAFSDKLLITEDTLYRMNSLPGEFPDKEIMVIDNTHMTAQEVAEVVYKQHL